MHSFTDFTHFSEQESRKMGAAEGKSKPRGGRLSVTWFLQVIVFFLTCLVLLHMLKGLQNIRTREFFVQTIETRELIFMEMVPAVGPINPKQTPYHAGTNKSTEMVSKDFRDATCDLQGGDIARFDCFPGPGANPQDCAARGCCWRQASYQYRRQIDVPYCYFPNNYPGYSVTQLKETDYGWSAVLTRSTPSPWPKDIKTLSLDVFFETETRLRLKIYDPNNKRYEVPLQTPSTGQKVSSSDYNVKIQKSPFGITVSRKSTGAILFDTVMDGAPLIFSDKFIQISTRVPSKSVYGLGERYGVLNEDFKRWTQLSFWNRDQAPEVGRNLYGDHRFFLSMEGDGNAHGVFLLNSNAMDIDLQPLPALTYRTIGGILDFYIFSGPSSDDVVSQYTKVIGRPLMPSYWSLGFHLSRYGYKNSTNMKGKIKKMREMGFPYDTQWSDIDYMERHLDWTFDKKNYGDLPEIVEDLHQHGQHYVIIVDPGISNTQAQGAYPPYDSGIASDVFVKNASGDVIIGAVWPGSTAFPDFTHPNSTQWWYESMADFHKQISFDGLWIDMNEPSNFVYGSTQGCTKSSLDKPPYTPGIITNDLPSQTLCPSAKQYLGSHYDLHSLYGHFEAVATRSGLKKLLNKRSLIITRSSFAGTGYYSGHWTGDNEATWNDLYFSIPEIITFQMYGITQVGADICGFRSSTNEELCTRWMQLGAFYPFMRNHNDLDQKDQDPTVWSKPAQDAMKSVTQLRYSLLTNLYTLFYFSHTMGMPVVRPLSFQYPTDQTALSIDRQFLWGDILLISPTTYKGQTVVKSYFPADVWYDYFSGDALAFVGKGQWLDLITPLHKINVHVRGGSVLFVQKPEVTTGKMRKNPFNLIVALCDKGKASGYLYWDDGESIGSVENGQYTFIEVTVHNGTLETNAEEKGYTVEDLSVASVKVMGVSKKPAGATVNGKPAKFVYNNNKVLEISGFPSVSLLEGLTVQWS